MNEAIQKLIKACKQLFTKPFPLERKVLYIDTETTGLHAVKNGIIQIAGIIEIDGQVKEEFNYKIKTFPDDIIVDKALEVTGTTREDIAGYTDPLVVHKMLKTIFKKYVNPYKKGKTPADKFYPAGFNVRFDIEMLDRWFKKCGDPYFGSWQNWHFLDGLHELHLMEYWGNVTLPNFKLATVAEYFGVDIDAHDALSDIRATRAILQEVFTNV